MIDRRAWLPLGVLLLAIGVLFYRLLLGEVIFWGTPLLQFYPWREMAFDMLRGGQLPLWNPLVGHGAPLLANYQTAVFYPPNWLYLLLPTEYAMGWVGLLHLSWAGLGMMALLRRYDVDRLGQGVGALAFSLSGYVVARFGFLTITSAVAWLPWLVWGVDGLLAGATRRRAALLAGIVAMLLLAGHAQTAFYSLLLAGGYALWRAAAHDDRRAAGGALAAALGAVLLGGALAAIQLAPTYELMRQSQRAAGVDAAAGLSYSFWPWHLLNFLAPGAFGSPLDGSYHSYGAHWEDAVYVGILPLLLTLRAAWRWGQERLGGRRSGEPRADAAPAAAVAPFFLIVLAPAAVLAFGSFTPIFPWLFAHVPTFAAFNAPARWMLLAVFSLAVLAGIGASDWQATDEPSAWPGRLTAIGLAILLAAAAAHYAIGAEAATLIRAFARLGVAVFVAGAVGLGLRLVRRRGDLRPAWEALALVAVAVDLVSAGWGLNPTVPAGLYHARSPLADVASPGTRTLWLPADEYDAKFDAFFLLSDYHVGDAAHWQAARASLLPNLGIIDGAPSASSFDPLMVGAHADVLAALDGLEGEALARAARELNVSVILSTHSHDLMVADAAGPTTAYAVDDPWPRAAVAACTESYGEVSCRPAPDGTATIVADDPTQVSIAAQSDGAAWLLLLDTDYPGWQATVDGAPAPIYPANGAFRAVELPPGEHTVTFRYRPASLTVGAIISGIGLLTLAALWFLRAGHPATSKPA